MSELISVAEAIRNELDDRYDGAPDSTTRWMGSHIFDLNKAIINAKREHAAACERTASRGERGL